MLNLRLWSVLAAGIAVLAGSAVGEAWAGGSGLNTIVVINQSSSNSCEAGNYYCERRQVPPENVLYINWTGSPISWTNTDFQTTLLNPLLAMLAARQLSTQADYVVLSMDIPYKTLNGATVNGTTSALFYGPKDDSGPDSAGITNSYFGSEQCFRQSPPASAPGYSFLATMITADSVTLAKQLIDQGVNSDSTFPSQPVILAKSSDYQRNLRYPGFDNAIFNARLCGNYQVQRTNLDSPWALTNLLGFETGLANFSVSPGTFVPGAMADSMTSFGGMILEASGQTSLLAFIGAGAAGSYGTVVEPSPDTSKFPGPQTYFYQARGFSLAECYYQSINAPYEGLIVAEPLAAPFQRPGTGAWLSPVSNAVLSGNVQLSLQFSAADATHPLQQIDLFVDGKYLRTLTNVAPPAGNVLTLTLNGQPLNYTNPPNATLASIASGLGSLIQGASASSASNITATVWGDRVELRSLTSRRPSPPTAVHALASPPQGTSNNSAGSGPPPLANASLGTASSLTSWLSPARSMFLNSRAVGVKSCFLSGSLQVGSWLKLDVVKTNGVLVSLAVTNQSASATPFDLATQFVGVINATPSLQGSDGLTAEDLSRGLFNSAWFNLLARGPGFSAALLSLTFTGSSGLAFTPSGQANLNDNLSDLQARNHVYVRAGVSNLGLSFPLDTTALPDGYHELTAVAYEGSSVRTQTRATVPVTVQNSTLSATMRLVDLTDPSPVQGTYHILVTANTNNVSAINLFSTGGLLATVTNQATNTFTVNGSNLGVGLHPFYAIVQTSTGASFRTPPQSVRLTAF